MKFILTILTAMLIFAGCSLPTSPALAVVEESSVGYCEGARSGAVTLVMNGVSQASALNLQALDADDPNTLSGVGKVDYSGYGISIKDDAAQFRIHLIDSPALPGTSCLRMVPKLIDFVEVFGGKGASAYHITTEQPVVLNDGTRCPSVSMTAVIDPQPRALGLLKRSFSIK